MRITQITDGAMMDDGHTFVFAQHNDYGSGDEISITVNASDSNEAHTKFQEVKAEAEGLGINFPDNFDWEIISSY